MEYLILPLGCKSTEPSSWEKTNEVSLGGFFYDHIKSQRGDLIGIRYYIDDSINPNEHPVFHFFLADSRFHFDALNECIDIFFEDNHEKDSFVIDAVQEFGGDHVLKSDGRYGIMVEV